MDKRDFAVLARMVRDLKGQVTEKARLKVAERLAGVCGQCGKGFHWDNFMSECGFVFFEEEKKGEKKECRDTKDLRDR